MVTATKGEKVCQRQIPTRAIRYIKAMQVIFFQKILLILKSNVMLRKNVLKPCMQSFNSLYKYSVLFTQKL